jgi:hypothetical protein
MLERGHNNGRASIKRTYFTFEQMRKECEKLAAFLAGGKFEIDREADESTRAAQAFLRKGLFGNAGESMLAPFIGQEPKQ